MAVAEASPMPDEQPVMTMLLGVVTNRSGQGLQLL
jgi:hypothetical protein